MSKYSDMKDFRKEYNVGEIIEVSAAHTYYRGHWDDYKDFMVKLDEVEKNKMIGTYVDYPDTKIEVRYKDVDSLRFMINKP